MMRLQSNATSRLRRLLTRTRARRVMTSDRYVDVTAAHSSSLPYPFQRDTDPGGQASALIVVPPRWRRTLTARCEGA
jgi:hypothetical protein